MATIYHNPRCSTSRTALERLQQQGYQPVIVEYLKTPLNQEQLAILIKNAGLTVRAAMRSKETIYQDLNLDNPDLTDDDLLNAIAQHPVLLNRPFVVTKKGTRLCRPGSIIEEIL